MSPLPGREPAPPAAEAYLEERRRTVLTRLRWSVYCALAPILVGVPLNLLVFEDRLPERLATFAVEAVLSLAMLLLCRWPAAARHAIPLAVGYAVGMVTCLFWALTLSPGDIDVLACPVASTMVFSTLLFSWGPGAQVVVSGYTAVGYLLLLPWAELDPSRITNILIGIVLGAGSSVVGALVLDRQRRATFVERERVSALAEQHELLLEVGRELNSSLELSEVVQRITRIGHRLVGSNSAALTLLDEARGVFRPVAMSTDQPGRNDDILNVEFSAAHAAPLLQAIAERGVLEMPGGTMFDALQQLIAIRFGFERTLFVGIRRDGRLVGYLNFSQRALEPPFSEARIRLADGIAHQAAIALANAQLVDDLRTASRVKSEFVSTMSHELRTPLHVIMGYTDMLPDTPAAQHPPLLDKIRAASRELLELIEATLNLNRLEVGKDAPSVEPVAVAALWEELASEFAALPARPGVALVWRGVGDLTLRTDRRKLKTILKNLVGNALKFTSRGEVVVTCTNDQGGCRFVVRDTGVGIEPTHLPVIFEMFRQVDSSDRRSYGGVGLGLYIVRRLLDQLGGSIDVASEPGRGSTFTVTLPHAAAEDGEPLRLTG
jgi:signal transduction histidine kinase